MENFDPIVPGYQIDNQICRHDSTAVYRATRQRDQQPVILKVLAREHAPPLAVERYYNEYEVARSLNVDGAIKVYGLEASSERLILVSEDFGAVALHDVMQDWQQGRSAKPPLSQLLKLARRIVTALAEIHAVGVIHKDINPSNIVLNSATGVVKIIDFGVATTLSRENPSLKHPQMLEGTLAYLSPEQTGRMNRTVDYRTDFYSFGATFYELLTGQSPFTAGDAMEMVHCHLARTPVAPHLLSPAIPQVVAELVLKLLAKAPEDRYQSTRGILHDLDMCLQNLQTYGEISPFELGRQDWTDHFLIPEKLYGREVEVATLLTAFERVAHGAAELMLVSGFSGIGKTAVINEIHKPIVYHRGYFIRGKFDQFNRNTPFLAIIQAFRDLVQQLLSQSEAQQQQWRAKILASVGESGQVVIELLPEMEQLIGPQPPVPELSGAAAQNRARLLFQRLVRVFATADHPVVMFLDDLQWADLTSLKQLHLLLGEFQSSYLLILGAYRDNEVSPAHPLMQTIAELMHDGITINSICLQTLQPAAINRLIADTLSCSLDQAMPLSQVVYQKTAGNPLFSNQFLKALYENGLITFDMNAGCWQCDISRAHSIALTDDIVEFMAMQLQKLSPETQEILTLAACVGNEFDLDTLAIIYRQSQAQTAADLWQALQEGFVVAPSESHIGIQRPVNDSDAPALPALRRPSSVVRRQESTTDFRKTVPGPVYRFFHDRVQQAAYALIPVARRPEIHLTIGRLLLDSTSEIEREERLFEIVSQLNVGLSLIDDPAERDTLARLNLQAGRKARHTTAYGAAEDYLVTALSLLPPDCWHADYTLILALHHELAEVAYLMGNFEQMEQWIAPVLAHAATLLDKVKIYEIQIQAQISRNQPRAALQLGLQMLHELGAGFPEQAGPAEIEEAFQSVRQALAGRPVTDLLYLPVMSDPISLATMRIMLSIGAPIFLVAPPLYPILIARQLLQSISYGNTGTSAYAYASYGMLLCGMVGDIESGHEFGQLALSLLQRLKSREMQARTYFMYYVFIHHRMSSIAETLDPLLDGYHAGLETGDLEFGTYCAAHYLANAYYCGYELNTLAAKADELLAVIRSHHQEIAYNHCSSCAQAIFNLLGQSNDPCALVGDACDERRLLSLYQQTGEISGLHHLIIQKLILSYLFGNYAQAKELALQSEQYVSGVAGTIAVVLHYVYASLVELALYESSDLETRAAILQHVEQNQEKIHPWADRAPMNYGHKRELVEAERARARGNRTEAIEHYDRAITQARANGFLQDEAMANELAAGFYLGWGKEKVALVYLHEARDCYRRWGATAKVAQLERRYPALLETTRQTLSRQQGAGRDRRSSSTTSSSTLDLATVMKAAQAIAGEIDLERLLKQMMRIVIENAGAQRGALILEHDGAWTIEAQAEVDSNEIVVLQSLDPFAATIVPAEIVSFVIRTSASLVLDDAAGQGDFTHDAYVIRNRVRSVLCVPLIDQGRLAGILYLENNLAARVFTPERLELLNLLSTQMALALDNARLYRQAQQEIAERTLIEAALRESESHLRRAETMAGIGYYAFDIGFDNTIFSDGVKKIFGFPPDSHPHFTQLMAYIHPDDQGKITEVLNRAIEELSGFDIEHRIVRPDGTEVVVHSSTEIIPGQSNRPARFFGTMVDITERKRVESELRASETRYRALVESQIDLISRYRPDTILTFVNDAYCKFYGKSREELIGKSWLMMVAPEFREQTLKETANFLKDPTPIHGEYINYRSDGQECWIYWILQGIVDEQGQIVEIQATGRDTTLLKHAEQALRAKEQAEAANRAKSVFLANMNHELRSPLNAILGFSDLMQREARTGRQPLTTEQQQNLARIQRSGEHLLTLINNVLDLSKIEAGRMTITPTNVSLAALLDDLEQMFALMASEKALALRIERDPRLPRFVSADAVKLRQVLINLLSNAIKFTEMGEVTARVEALSADSASPDMCYVRFEVADTGPGIPPEDMPHLFEAFTQLSTGRSKAGAGLGLSISHQFVHLMGGELGVQSRPGQGARFQFTIPLQVVELADVIPAPSERRALGLAPGQPHYRILIVDDDETNRRLLCQLLRPLGFEIREACNGKDAINVWQEWQPQLIVMDIRMPVLSGAEATRQIKATPRGAATKIIALTASSFAEERSTVMAAGCDDFLRKPFHEADLLSMIEQHLEAQLLYIEDASAPPPARSSTQADLSELIAGLARLPSALLAHLERAAVRANMGEVNDLIVEVQYHDAAVAQMLSELARLFEYPRIVQLIQSARPNA